MCISSAAGNSSIDPRSTIENVTQIIDNYTRTGIPYSKKYLEKNTPADQEDKYASIFRRLKEMREEAAKAAAAEASAVSEEATESKTQQTMT